MDGYHGIVLPKDNVAIFTVAFRQPRLTQYLIRYHPLGSLLSGQQGQCFLTGVDTLDMGSSLHSQDAHLQAPGRNWGWVHPPRFTVTH